MANPVLAKLIGVKVGTTANVGEYVIVRNITRGGQLTQKLSGTDRSTVFNPAPALAWQDGDLIQAEMRGRLAGVAQRKIQSGGVQFTAGDLSVSADTSSPGVDL